MSALRSRVAHGVAPGSFEPAQHFYPRVLNAHIHPVVRSFMNLTRERLVERYAHLHPEVDRDAILDALVTSTSHFRWGGADLFQVTTNNGVRRMVVIETNSCPSGQKSMPVIEENQEQAGYRRLLEQAFLPMLKRRTLPAGDLAVLYDKNGMEASGYAATLADLTGESVWLVPCPLHSTDPAIRMDNDVVQVRAPDERWRPVRAALRYVTQKPWTRISPITRTAVFNPVLVCLAGGRNKMLASKAYDLYNAKMFSSGLQIRTPETIWDLTRAEVPLWVERMGGVATIKNPYSNAGQGVYTVTNESELEEFMSSEQNYDRFIVQALIGNFAWSSRSSSGAFYHIGTVPDKKARIFAADLRFMVGCGPSGFFPTAIYSRRAQEPLRATLDGDHRSWEMLGTNLSKKTGEGEWTTETDRLLLMDSRDFNRLGMGLDDLIEAYIQTVLAVTAIDDMASGLLTTKGKFRQKFFRSLNPDSALMAEILRDSPQSTAP